MDKVSFGNTHEEVASIWASIAAADTGCGRRGDGVTPGTAAPHIFSVQAYILLHD